MGYMNGLVLYSLTQIQVCTGKRSSNHPTTWAIDKWFSKSSTQTSSNSVTHWCCVRYIHTHPAPNLVTQNLWGEAQHSYLTFSPNDSDACSSLKNTAVDVLFPIQKRKSKYHEGHFLVSAVILRRAHHQLNTPHCVASISKWRIY